MTETDSNNSKKQKYSNKSKKSENIKKPESENIFKNKQVCPYCQFIVEFVYVHGHYQCPVCKNVIIGCCGD